MPFGGKSGVVNDHTVEIVVMDLMGTNRESGIGCGIWDQDSEVLSDVGAVRPLLDDHSNHWQIPTALTGIGNR